eukprot:scaffold191500_cov26-Tisochrysis_lutea.AAC.1
MFEWLLCLAAAPNCWIKIACLHAPCVDYPVVLVQANSAAAAPKLPPHLCPAYWLPLLVQANSAAAAAPKPPVCEFDHNRKKWTIENQ